MQNVFNVLILKTLMFNSSNSLIEYPIISNGNMLSKYSTNNSTEIPWKFFHYIPIDILIPKFNEMLRSKILGFFSKSINDLLVGHQLNENGRGRLGFKVNNN